MSERICVICGERSIHRDAVVFMGHGAKPEKAQVCDVCAEEARARRIQKMKERGEL